MSRPDAMRARLSRRATLYVPTRFLIAGDAATPLLSARNGADWALYRQT